MDSASHNGSPSDANGYWADGQAGKAPTQVPAGLPPIAPDAMESSDCAIDNAVPTRGYAMTPMVGLGGSAGSIPALIQFFQSMPVDSGLVFVVILHLSPSHESTLAALLGNHTSMPVVQARNGQRVESNHVYVIPPGKYLTATDGELRLVDLENETGRRNAVDMFFRSLADTHGSHGMAVVLSGVDGDGALGIKRMKERGGLTIAQNPTEAEHPGMPRSAIETGMVDWVLPVGEIGARLIVYCQSEDRLRLPPEEGPSPAETPRTPVDEAEVALREVLILLRTRTGRDFAGYKRATILRRIARRMQVNGVLDLPAYLTYLRTHTGESGALLQDLLISVTNFFRDRDAFDALERQIPALFRDKAPSDVLRAWVPACATGEEAYSVAILLMEHAATLEAPPVLQVFACDLNDEAIQAARTGLFPRSIEADVSEARLRRFFVREHGGYRVRRELREKVLFASHDLLKDAPFSRMDLVSCRNLLIYLGREAQRRVLDTFYFALRPEGRLFLGTSEAAEDAGAQFHIVDKNHRIYAQIPGIRQLGPLPLGSGTMARALAAHDHAHASPVVHGAGFISPNVPGTFRGTLERGLDRAALAELHYRLIERYAPPSVIVNADHEVMHLSEHAGRFLQYAGGEPTTNLMRMVAPALRVDLRAALFRAAESGRPVETFSVRAEIDGKESRVNIRVFPAPELVSGHMLVVFDSTPEENVAGMDVGPGPEPAARHIERELELVKGQLRDTVEQYEASTEELKASNEELQAMNEELRSATEELETSREELQSINEELSTVNLEMKRKMDELAGANSDMQNLMASTAIATVFLDRRLTIMRFTPSAAGMFNMIPGDIGRPLAHLQHRLDYPDLIADAESVLRTLVPIEREVRSGEQWFLSRVQPYRTLEDHIAGVVLTLVDVTERNRAVEALRASEERLRLVLESAKDYAIFTMDHDRRINGWNTGAQTMFGYAESAILGDTADILFTPEDRAAGEPERVIAVTRQGGRAGSERWYARADGSTFFGSGSVMPLLENRGERRGFVQIIRDLTESKRNEDALRDADRRKDDFLAMLGHELRNPLAAIRAATHILELSEGPLAAPEGQRDAVKVIDRQLAHLSRMVNDLLDVSRFLKGGYRLDLAPVDLRVVVGHAVATAGPMLRQRRHQLDVRLPDRPVAVQVDPFRIEGVVANLLVNAAKYTPDDGHGRIEVALEAPAPGAAGEIVLSVRDNGEGIDPELLKDGRIFQLFVQGERSLDRALGGLGVGLSLVHQVVTLHGGTVEATSDGPGRGSTFVVRLPVPAGAITLPGPVAPARSRSGGPNAPAPPPDKGASIAGLSALIVDDNQDFARMVGGALEATGVNVNLADSGAEGLNAALRQRPDVVFLDIGLPGMNGYEVARAIRAEGSEWAASVVLVAVTGYARPDDLRAAAAAGFNDHLTKPAEIDDFRRVLGRSAGTARSRRVAASAAPPASESAAGKLRVLCVDDSEDLTSSLRRLLNADPGMACVGCLHSADSLSEEVARLSPDIVLLDAKMPGKDPLLALAEVHAVFPKVRIIVFSGRDDAAFVESATRAGAVRCLGKHEHVAEMLRVIREVGGAARASPRRG